MLGFHPIGAAPLGALAQVAVYAEFPASYAIVRDAPVAVYAEFLGSYAILRDAPYVPTQVYAEFAASYAILRNAPLSEVFAEFPASYKINSSIIMAYTPSKARMLKVSASGAAFAAPYPGYWNMADPKKPKGLKDPNSTIDISLDWTEYLTDIGDAIASHTMVIPSELSNLGSAVKDGIVTVFVSGGAAPGTYGVTFRVTTASAPARVEDRTVYLLIEER